MRPKQPVLLCPGHIKSMFALPALCWALLLSLHVGPTAADEVNLMPNGGFEQWEERPAAGQPWGAHKYQVGVAGRGDTPRPGTAYRTGQGELDTERHSGRYAQFVSTTTWGNGLVSPSMPVTAGHKYRVSVWLKMVSGENFKMGVCFAHAPWTYLGEWVYGKPNGRWTQYTKEIEVPASCTRIVAVLFLEPGSGYFDDLEVVDLGVVEPANEEASPEEDRVALSPGHLAPAIARKRVAIFDEPGFPSESPRSADWYEQVLQDAGLATQRLRLAQLCKRRVFSIRDFDTLILPTGGCFPDAAEVQVEKFLADGGTLVIDEHTMVRTQPPPEDLKQETAARRKQHDSGEQIYEYNEFMATHTWGSGTNIFEFNEAEERWCPSLAQYQCYTGTYHKWYPRGLLLRPWPNYVGGAPLYSRPFSEDLLRNPDLEPMLANLPPTIPADENPSKARGALRMCLPGHQGFGSGAAEEFACDLLLSLYVFPEVSGYAYPAFPDAGKDPIDRQSDFYILRYHNQRMKGGTLLHFGIAGAKLLAGEQGADVLLESLRLAESELPGECPPDFIQVANETRAAFSEYSGKSIEIRKLISELAQIAYYDGKNETLEKLRADFQQEQQRFEALSTRAQELDRLLIKRDEFAYGHNARERLLNELLAETPRLTRELKGLRKQVARQVNPPADVKIQNPFSRIYFGLDNAYARGARGLAELRERVEDLGLRWEGFHTSGYRMEYIRNSNPFKTRFESGLLDPKTGEIQKSSWTWMADEAAWEGWRQTHRWQLERLSRDPRITEIRGWCEYGMDWALWGEYMHALFLRYLEEKYGSVEQLNAVWGTAYQSFEAVKLPVSRPLTQAEHALWEDWTRYREVYVRDWMLSPMLKGLEQYAPDLLYLPWGTYDQHGKYPAHGVNFYEYGKLFKINGFEHSNRPSKEWLTFDIISMFSPNCTGEWGTFYFPPGPHQSKLDLLAERLWSGISNGQIGWSLFTFSVPGRSGANYFDTVNLPLPLGWQLVSINQEFCKFDHIILDGARQEPEIRIVYSPTTRRHTSWPGIEEDLSFREVFGLYQFFDQAHINARAIDEQAIWEGHLPAECKLVILPEVIYQNAALQTTLLDFVEKGGNLLITPGSGRFDEYGHRQDSWLVLAGVVPSEARDKTVQLGEGMRYFSAGHADKMCGLEPLFPEETEVLVRYRDGTPAITRTRLEKGNIFVMGMDLGQDCHDQYGGKPEVPAALLQPVLRAAGISKDYVVSDAQISVRPWIYKGQRYLFLTNRGRESFREYELGIAGHWKVRDYLLGHDLKVSFDGESSQVTGLMPSPGGILLALTPGDAQAPSAAVVRPTEPATTVAAEAPPAGTRPAQSLNGQTPFEGRLWARDGAITLGDFVFSIEVETGGGWGGKFYLLVEYGKERIRKLCTKGATVTFAFTDRILTVDCQEVVDVYPVNVKCRITVSKPAEVVSQCSLQREDYLGHESIVLTNGLLKIRLLPRLGGRMIEFISLVDETNHALCNEDLIRQGVGDGWDDLGGMEENAGGWPGPYWNAEFVPTIISDTPERVAVQLTMKEPVQWQYGYAQPKSGNNRLEKEFALEKGSSQLSVRLRAFNESKAAMPTGLRTHPIWRVGGDADPGDTWYVPGADGLKTLRFPFSETFPAEAGWTAIVDGAKRCALIQGYSQEATESVYTCPGQQGYNLELVAKVRPIEAGQALEFTHTLAFIRGLAGVYAYADGIAVNVDIVGSDVLGAGGQLTFDTEVGATKSSAGTVTVAIQHGDQTITTLDPWELTLQAGRANTRTYKWQSTGQPDGDYCIVVSFRDAEGEERIRGEHAFTVAGGVQAQIIASLSEYEEQIKALKAAYVQLRADEAAAATLREARVRITRAAILLAEARQLALENRTAESSTRQAILRESLAGGN